MKTIKFLFVTAIVAGLAVSCETDNGMMEMITTHDSLVVGAETDTTQNSADMDSTQNGACKDSVLNVADPDTTQTVIYINPGQSFPYVSGSGEIATQAVHLADFSEVELMKTGEVEIISGSEYKVEISDYENLLSYAKVYLEGKKLVISYDSVQVMGSKLKISITIPDQLTKAIVSGSGSILVNSGFASESVQLMVSGAGNVIASNINSSVVHIVLSGAGTIEAKGTTGKLMLDVKGSGTIKCKELICADADCDIRGVSNVFVSVTDKLKVCAFVVGSLTYYGDPILEVEKGLLFSLIKG
ncbi:MAG: DUF2807 domain-containing protein [Prolixibacteraceae bacterium]|nr:DUF2807 domain-containing protein [Prolixibacteraceae bacterium]